MRKIDSRIRSPGFNCCAFLFHSPSSVTFATISASRGSELNREGDARGQQQWLSAAGKDVAQRRPTEGLLQNFSLRCRLRFRHRR